VELPDPRSYGERAVARRVVKRERGPVLGEYRGLQRPQAVGVRLGDLAVQQRLADAPTASGLGDVDAGLADAGVDRALRDRADTGPADDLAVALGDPAVAGQPLRRQRLERRYLGLERRHPGRDPLGVDVLDGGQV